MEDLFLKNSLKLESNISNALIELYKDELNETSGVSGIASYKAFIRDVIKRVKDDSNLNRICSVIPTPVPQGKIYALGNKLVGKESVSAVATDDIKIIEVADPTGYAEDGKISSTGDSATGDVLHVEGNYLLVKVDSGTFAINDTVDNAQPFVSGSSTISTIFNATHMMGTIFPDYSGPYSAEAGESISDYKQYDLLVTGVDIEATTKFGNSNITLETIKDMITQHGLAYRPTLINMIKKIMSDIERNDVFSYLRSTAYNRANIILDTANGPISQIYGDLYNRVNQSIGTIGTNTGITGGKYGVVASSKVYAGIKTFLGSDIRENKQGELVLPDGTYLIEDGYTVQDYLCVSLIGPDDNGAVVFSPYDMQVVEAQDPVTFSKRIKVLDRYDVVDSPLAKKVNDQSKNEMAEYSAVDFTAVVNEI